MVGICNLPKFNPIPMFFDLLYCVIESNSGGFGCVSICLDYHTSYMLIIEIHDMGKRQVKNESALKEIRLPEEGELFGRVLKMMGGENVMIKCDDNITRRGRIRGKLKRRVWIRDNDIVIIAPWDFKQDERGDIVWRFTLPQVEWLKTQNHIPKDF